MEEKRVVGYRLCFSVVLVALGLRVVKQVVFLSVASLITVIVSLSCT